MEPLSLGTTQLLCCCRHVQRVRREGMTNRLMLSVAALALIAGTNMANAQVSGSRDSDRAQMQNAPSSSGGGAATEHRENSRSAAGASQNQHADQNKHQNQRADEGKDQRLDASQNQRAGQNKYQNHADENKNQRAEENMPGSRSKSMNSENEKNMKTEGQGRTHGMDAQTGTDRSRVTTGQTSAGAKLSTDQRTRITSIIRNE